MTPWEEYAATVAYWDEPVTTNPTRDTYRERWQARIRHPSWEQKRQALIWMCRNKCERCHERGDLQLHHLHYDTLWYENHSDLQLLCRPCHRDADQERAEEAAYNAGGSVQARIYAYMEIANRFSGQADWPVTYEMARDYIEGRK